MKLSITLKCKGVPPETHGSAMEYLNEYYPGETILRMELRK